jgi:hypothetical protein
MPPAMVMDPANPVPTGLRQCAGALCMVRPAAFAFNAETAASNRFQSPSRLDAGDDAAVALAQFDALVSQLRHAGVRVLVIEDTPQPPKPDAVFPNNWVSFHADGTVVLYPMQSPSRRRERREDLVHAVAQHLGFTVRRVLDLSPHEADGRFLEGTGSLVLDHAERMAYACRSPRTDETLVQEWCRQLDYEPLLFDAATPDGTPVYHTNVLLWIGDAAVGVGSPWIAAADRPRVLARLAASGRDLIELPEPALQAFAGNMLEVRCADGDAGRALVLSASAAARLDAQALERLAAATDQLVIASVPTLERCGGGSVRCMLTEVPL